ICRIVCEETGYRMAWVGYAEHDEAKSVRPVAWTGAEADYLATSGITWADTDRGRGPTGEAIRSGKSCCVQDFATDPRLAPWRESLLQRGFRSGIALPLKDENDNAFGSLTIHCAQPNAFTSEEIRLLEELSGDLAFGIITLRSRAARKQAEQQVTLLSFALNNVRDTAWLIDDTGRLHYVSDEACRVLGYTREELLGMGIPDIDPDFPPERWSGHWRDLTQQRSLNFETRHRTRDGRILPVEVSANYFEYGGRSYNLALARDISERKRAEEALRESERFQRTLLENLPDCIARFDREGRHLFVNSAVAKVFGAPPEQFIGKTLRECGTPGLEPQNLVLEGLLKQAFEEGVANSTEAEWTTTQGIRHFDVRHVPEKDETGNVITVVGISRDITDRKRAEENLRQSEAELRQIVDAVPQHVVVLEPDGEFRYVNRGDLEYTGLTLEEVHAADYPARIFHPNDWERLRDDRQHALAQGIPWEAEARLLGKDGQYRWFLIRLNPLRDEQGRIIRWYGTRTDIEDRKQAEEKVQQSEGELRQILNLTPQLVAVLEPDGRISYANEIMLQYTGLTLEDVRAEDFRSRVFHSDDVERVRDERQNALSRSVPFENEQRVLGKNGKYRWFFFRYNPLHDAQGRLIRWYASGTDVEDRKQAEERLQHENVVLREEIDKTSMFEEIVGTSAALQTVLSRVSKVAPTDSTVLLTGETGTGKELVARAIHRRSHRSSRAFVSVNCAAIPRDLIASELFGHEKGAFTGATQQRLGRFELAGGGTIFLDEVGELPAETQIALLRVLQEHEFERVGGNRSIQTDVRVIAATNRDLQAAIAAGTFRSDLFYRLNVFPIEIPPLRKRKEDIPLLVAYFIDRFARQAGKRIQGLNKKTLELFQ